VSVVTDEALRRACDAGVPVLSGIRLIIHMMRRTRR
jgi:hypothetical protein